MIYNDTHLWKEHHRVALARWAHALHQSVIEVGVEVGIDEGQVIRTQREVEDLKYAMSEGEKTPKYAEKIPVEWIAIFGPELADSHGRRLEIRLSVRVVDGDHRMKSEVYVSHPSGGYTVANLRAFGHTASAVAKLATQLDASLSEVLRSIGPEPQDPAKVAAERKSRK